MCIERSFLKKAKREKIIIVFVCAYELTMSQSVCAKGYIGHTYVSMFNVCIYVLVHAHKYTPITKQKMFKDIFKKHANDLFFTLPFYSLFRIIYDM